MSITCRNIFRVYYSLLVIMKLLLGQIESTRAVERLPLNFCTPVWRENRSKSIPMKVIKVADTLQSDAYYCKVIGTWSLITTGAILTPRDAWTEPLHF